MKKIAGSFVVLLCSAVFCGSVLAAQTGLEGTIWCEDTKCKGYYQGRVYWVLDNDNASDWTNMANYRDNSQDLYVEWADLRMLRRFSWFGTVGEYDMGAEEMECRRSKRFSGKASV